MSIQDDNALAEPIVERISSNIVETMKELTTAEGLLKNATIFRPSPADPPQIIDYRLIIVQGNPEEDEDSQTPYGLKSWVQPYAIECEVVLPETATEAIDRALNRLRSIVEKKLMEDRTRGGLASHNDGTTIRPPTLSDVTATARRGTITVNVEVRYRTLENDPWRLPGE